jgi:hypothetical protein
MKLTRAACIAVVLTACLDNEQDLDTAGRATAFIALDRDFADYGSWQSFDLGETVIEGLPFGRRRLYVSAMPAAGAEEFPVGTKLVKVFEDPDLPEAEWDIYAMVKRGGGFNGNGAVNWEWFELVRDSSGEVSTEWRGTEPPAGRNYRCLLTTNNSPDCNACHAASKSNDYVNSAPLQLH